MSREAEEASILQRVVEPEGEVYGTVGRPAPRIADLLEGWALTSTGEERTRLFSEAFSCWRAAAAHGVADGAMLDEGYLPPEISVAFHLAVAGYLGERPSEAEHALARALPNAAALRTRPREPTTWRDVLLYDIALSVVLLVRRAGGWADVGLAIEMMDGLRVKQRHLESHYLDEAAGDATRRTLELAACYHIAQVVTAAGKFLATGEGIRNRIVAELERHRDLALEACQRINDGVLARLARLTCAVAVAMATACVWNQLGGLGARMREFARELADARSERPLLGLWPSQRQALRENLLDPYARAVIVEMPTSAGKTLLAKLSVVQTLALNPNSTIAYVVPTRALVNQVVDEFASDFRPLGYSVEQAVPAVEIDPTEDRLLQTPPSLLITTAEKLDLLIRSGHPSVEDISQVIVDEAHNIGDGIRGARLELLLATLRRDRADARFLLLSPFVPSSDELAAWLGGEQGGSPILVRWRPNRRVVAAIEGVKRGRGTYDVALKTIEAADNSDLAPGLEIVLERNVKRPTALKKLSLVAASALSSRAGVTLILCAGKGTAMERAQEVADGLDPVDGSPLRAAILAHLEDELGAANPLSPLLERGIAYHHAGMSLETRRLVERLVLTDQVHTVCGTTTLAQGVNFPINNVIIESRSKGASATMSFSDFWNVAGRAGRGRYGDLGVVAFPVATQAQRDGWADFFRQEARVVASSLASLVAAADRISGDFTLATLGTHEVLSPFLQYLAHAMRISGAADAAGDIEDLLRNSLVYRQATAKSPELGAALAALCRAYLDSLRSTPGLVALADGTGFSTVTINALRARAAGTADISDPASWAPAHLFGSDLGPLTARVDLLGSLPELQLGSDYHGRFNPERIAEILCSWIRGVSIEEMVARFAPGKNGEMKPAEFTSYLYSLLTQNASWGMGALQRVAWAGTTHKDYGDAAYVPSMVYYGVDTREAIWMRMIGLPRESAGRAAAVWRRKNRSHPESYAELRGFVSGLTADEWDQHGGESAITGEQMKLLWRELM
jgi:hypothetical protein